MKAWTARDIRNLRTKGSRSWYEIKNQTNGPARIDIYDEIGGWGVYAADFIRDLNNVSGPVDLHISSEGGEVFEGLNIYNAIKQRGNVTTYIDSLAASIASVIALAGQKVVMSKTATLMIHDAAGLAVGNAKDMRELADLLDKASNNIAGVYAEKAGGDVTSWRSAMETETWYSAQEALDAGLVDEILGDAPVTAKAAKAPQVTSQAVVDPQIDNVVTPSAPEPERTEEPEAFEFAAFLAQMNAAKEAIARG